MTNHEHIWWRCCGGVGDCPEYDHDFCGCGAVRPHIDGQTKGELAHTATLRIIDGEPYEFCVECNKHVPVSQMPEGDICNKHFNQGAAL